MSLKTLDSKKNFLGVNEEGRWPSSCFTVLPAPLELTTTYMKGTGNGPLALLEASRQVELWDDELKVKTVRAGIATLPLMEFKGLSPEQAMEALELRTGEILDEGKMPAVIGGEHSLTTGVIRAFAKRFPGLSVLHLDAHADLRESYEGSPLNHACVMARVGEMVPFVSAGLRSLSPEEADKIDREGLVVFDMHTLRRNPDWSVSAIRALSDTVYITLDLDVLDPSVMPAVGTPEPGGMMWYPLLDFLKDVFASKRVVGVDMVELCPSVDPGAGAFTAAKLLYRMLGYWNQSLDLK
jgi:agmatinase